ncbi:MAG: ATP-binding cassette domain-containing protein, partial [Chloroflexota bacterium]
AGNDAPTSGSAQVAGHNLATLSGKRAALSRRRVIGFVWQQTGRNLLPYLSAQQNIEQPLYYAGTFGKAAHYRAAALLELVGLRDRARHKPDALSGGEQQRVAIAIALANSPRVLFADEPTGELDSATAQEILGMLKTAQEQLGVTVVVVTHDPKVADVADRTIAIRDGRAGAERVRLATVTTVNGPAGTTHHEYAVIDRAGRLQIPQEYLRALGIDDRAVLRLEKDQIVIEPLPAAKASHS